MPSRILACASLAALVLAALGASGCSADPGGDVAQAPEQDLTTQAAGSGDIKFSIATFYYEPGPANDRFLRVGEKLRFLADVSTIASELDPRCFGSQCAPDLAHINTAWHATYLLDYGAGAPVEVPVKFIQGNLGVYGTTDEQTIPNGADNLKVTLNLSDDKGHTKVIENGPGMAIEQNFPIFGGHIPEKTALFDDDHGRRERIIEGGAPVKGAKLDVSYSEWRKQGVVGWPQNLKIGRMHGSDGRGRPQDEDVFGRVEWEVTYVASFHGFHTQITGKLDEVDRPKEARALFTGGNTWSRTTLNVPAGASELQIAFEVKAYLVADYPNDSRVFEKDYAQGDRRLLADTWDNPGGISGKNYTFATEP